MLKQSQQRKCMPVLYFYIPAGMVSTHTPKCVFWGAVGTVSCCAARTKWAVRSGGCKISSHYFIAEVPPALAHPASTNMTTLSTLPGSNTRSWIKTLLQGPCCYHVYAFLSVSLDMLLVAINYRRSCTQYNLLLISSSVTRKPLYG